MPAGRGVRPAARPPGQSRRGRAQSVRPLGSSATKSGSLARPRKPAKKPGKMWLLASRWLAGAFRLTPAGSAPRPGRRWFKTAPKVGKSVGSLRGFVVGRAWRTPVSMACMATVCVLSGWLTERTTARRCACRATRGMCSPTRRPGALVATGRNSPRHSVSPSGLRSQMSWWAGAPKRKTRMHDFARPALAGARAARARRSPGRPRPTAGTAPTRSHSRRVRPSHRRIGDSATASMVHPR